MAKWETTTGKIVKSEVGVYVSSEGDNMDQPIIHWAYRVNGVNYRGEMPEMGYYRAKQLVAKYPVGMEVEVRYNTANPEISVVKGLEGLIGLGRSTGLLVAVFLAVTFVFFAVIMLSTQAGN
ncbi:MAG: DUF3592 domain-containing protein [Anaerolineae bacterium]|nr:DUF3592 domain-containing protein [Anaerolineae bacterium]MDW8174024.1 DUF3592 domain-containing protein [Anaerolineae bacterium]